MLAPSRRSVAKPMQSRIREDGVFARRTNREAASSMSMRSMISAEDQKK